MAVPELGNVIWENVHGPRVGRLTQWEIHTLRIAMPTSKAVFLRIVPLNWRHLRGGIWNLLSLLNIDMWDWGIGGRKFGNDFLR